MAWRITVGAAAAVVAAVGMAAIPRAARAAAPPALAVDGAGGHAISDLIYGWNFAPTYAGVPEDEGLEAELRIPVERMGGNTASTTNWKNNAVNTGNDYYFENQPNWWQANSGTGPATDGFVRRNLAHHEATILTAPLLGWTPKDSPSRPPFLCSYPVTSYPTTDWDQYDPSCGSGKRPDGSYYDANPNRAYFAIDSSWARDFVAHNVATFGNGGVPLYSLDNEPDLWHSTHHDVHPKPATYDEIAGVGANYARAIKSADPTALTLGPVTSGWCALFFSPADGSQTVLNDTRGCATGPDRTAHGGLELTRYYLQQMRRQSGAGRLLDYLDVHYYPSGPTYADGSPTNTGAVYPSDGSNDNAQTEAARLRLVRSLWDPRYTDETWIGHDVNAEPIQLIRRLRRWIDADYPGTKLAISEYSFGGRTSLNGALAEADVLGVFGREGVDLANLFDTPRSADPVAFAFRMYRNYDGGGGHFGDVALTSASGDQGRLAVYGARRTSDGALTVMVINKTGDPIDAPLALRNSPSVRAAAQRYTYSAADLHHISAAPITVSAGGWRTTYPPNSLTLVVVPRS